MLVEFRLVEQRYQAVLEVLNDGATVVDVGRRYGVARQTVHAWLRSYAASGLAGLADRSSKPLSCPHQMAPVVEARIVEMRREHPGWGSRTILFWLEREGVGPLPGRTAVERCLVRHGLVDPQARKRKRSDYKRWERRRAMELWQMDIVGGVRLADGSEAKIVSGIDDHSRFVISAAVVARATARPVCDALVAAMSHHGAPEAILTDNGKVFTARFGPGPGPVLFDRICRENGIKHLLTGPSRRRPPGRSSVGTRRCGPSSSPGRCSPIWPTPRSSWTSGCTRTTTSGRTSRSVGFHRSSGSAGRASTGAGAGRGGGRDPERAVTTRRVTAKGTIGFATATYKAGTGLAGQTVEVVCDGGLVHIHHRGVLIATHARRHPVDKQPAGVERGRRLVPSRPAARSATVASVTRKVDSSGNVCFAGASYRVGSKYRRRQVQVAVVGDTVEVSIGNELIRSHPVRHDRTR